MLAPRSSLCSFVSAITLAALVSVALVVSMTGTATAEPVAAGYRDSLPPPVHLCAITRILGPGR